MRRYLVRGKNMSAALVLAAVVAIFGMLTASPAAAAGGDWLYTQGGQGYATWSWSTTNYGNIDNITKVAWDTVCNASGVYTYLKIYQVLSDYTGSSVNDSCSGGSTSTTGGYFHGSNNILGVRVFVCEDVWGPDDCSSQYYDNPYT